MIKTPEQFALEIMNATSLYPYEKAKKAIIAAIRDRDFLITTSHNEAIGGTV